MRALGLVICAFVVAAACGGQSHHDDGGVTAGAEPTSGGGAGGTGSASGRGGRDVGAGNAGTGNAGGSAGNDGEFTSHGDAECDFDENCQVIQTCCSCQPAPAFATAAECNLGCEQSACGARGFQNPVAVCRGNRCVFDVSCNAAQVTCDQAEPQCPDGLIASVQGSCWGPCVDPTECSEIADCADCPSTGNQLCVTDSSDISTTNHCVELTSACAANPTCDCVAACWSACDDTEGIGCFCPDC